MSRRKEFDESEVLDQALELFRARGFERTSFADLTEHLGVSRQSLYDTYGDKHALYHSSLRRYLTQRTAMLRQKLEDPSPIRELLAQLLEGIVQGNCSNGSPGCLLVNSMVEQSPHDAATRALAQEFARTMEGLLASRLSLAQRGGEIAPDKDPLALARYLHHMILGLAVASRALGDRESLRASISLALRALD